MKALKYLFFFVFSITFAQHSTPLPQQKWVDSVYNQLSFKERIGQLFMVAAYSNKKEKHFTAIDSLVEKYKIGGLIFFQGGPMRQAKLTNRYQAKAKLPLLIGIDAEWGLSMRLDSTHSYPWNMTLGAIKEYELLKKTGQQIAQQAKRMGIHFTFSPVVDSNTNPNNPIIGNRSFGEDKNNVTSAAIAFMKGLQQEGVFATAKHFPGHGDTNTDSHYTLPVVNFSKERLHNVELYPYKKMIENGLSSIMVAHLSVPSLEKRVNYPSSLSYNVVTKLLKEELQFSGLIFTDALNMKGASNFKEPGDIDVAAFLAGNDVLLFSENVPKAIQKFEEAFAKGIITEERLAESVKKILQYKYKAKLYQYKPIVLDNLYKDLNQPKYEALTYTLYQNAITLLQNKSKIIPIRNIDKEKIAYVHLGNAPGNTFLHKLNAYAQVTAVTASNISELLQKLQSYTKVIIGYHKPNGAWKNHNFTTEELQKIQQISAQNKIILTAFTKPYSLASIEDLSTIETVVLAYQNTEIAQTVAAEAIFGAIACKGRLPVSIATKFKVNEGLQTQKLYRLGFDVPENVGLNSQKLAQIDSIANYAIAHKMAPGMQILVARKGKIIYQKTFGYYTYQKKQKVKDNSLYDVASLTKILATLPNVMLQYEKGNIQLNTKLKEMLPVFSFSNKANATLVDMLTHQARFYPWIPFYKTTLDSLNKPSEKWYRKKYSNEFPTKITENLYLKKGYNDSIIKTIARSKLLKKKKYRYSDFSFIILKEYLEKTTGKPLDKLTQDNFYKKIGANRMTYNPLDKFSKSEIVPTEKDTYFRYTTLQGNVHDMAAAMQGGIGGHAGIFATSLEVAKMMQLFLQEGVYGGYQFFSKATLDVFNTCYYCNEDNRRGIGFDKPQLKEKGPTCGCVSMTSFGHTGFTGTMAWADPEEELVYVFLSNRTYPNYKENTLSKENIRENIQKIIYEAIEE